MDHAEREEKKHCPPISHSFPGMSAFDSAAAIATTTGTNRSSPPGRAQTLGLLTWQIGGKSWIWASAASTSMALSAVNAQLITKGWYY